MMSKGYAILPMVLNYISYQISQQIIRETRGVPVLTSCVPVVNSGVPGRSTH
jgi:hypothetical protein